MSTRSNDVQLVAWRAFLSAHATVIRLLEEEMDREQGLPLSWFDVLAHLERAPDGRLRMQELAGSVVISRSGLTRLFDRIAEAGKLVRVARPIPDNSLAMGVVGTAHLMWPAAGVGIPEMYGLEPESLEDQAKVNGMLFTQEELEALP